MSNDLENSLNLDCILHVLKYCTPDTVCKVSRTCKSLNQLVSRYIKHLPHPVASLRVVGDKDNRTFEFRMFDKDEVVILAKNNISPETFDFKKIKSSIKYVDVRDIKVTMCGDEYSAYLAHCGTRNVWNMGVSDISFLWRGGMNGIICWDCCFQRPCLICAYHYSSEDIIESLKIYEQSLSVHQFQAVGAYADTSYIANVVPLLLHATSGFCIRDLPSSTADVIGLIRLILKESDAGKLLARFCASFKITDAENIKPKFDEFTLELKATRAKQIMTEDPNFRINLVLLNLPDGHVLLQSYSLISVVFVHSLPYNFQAIQDNNTNCVINDQH